jgi:nuclear pore complex protein Nup98-Nup96
MLTLAQEDEKQHADNLLRLQVQHTTVEMGDDGIPYINTHKNLSFRTFMTPSGGDHGFESTLWKLGAALFDRLDSRVPPSMSAGALDRIENLRRKQAVGDWLRSAVSGTVENAVATASSINAQIFILLTGNQVERACHLAVEAHNFKLASLIAQIGGSPQFRRDIASQLVVWRKSVADAWIDDDIRKIFALMTGDITVVQASISTDPFQKASELRIDDGLDWKRTFGLQLWYGNYLEDTLLASVDAFEARAGTAQPQPWYLEGALKKKGSPWTTRSETDALFELIKLSVDPAYGLENVLNPRAYTSSPLDYRCVWHVYMLLSRGLQAGDFSSDAASFAASAVTINYAAQLEALGMYEHAVFVLLHLDDPPS